MHCYFSGVLLLAKPVLYPAHFYLCSGDEFAALAARLSFMLRFNASVSIVFTVFEMMMF
jgi:hypothetical protein